MNLLRESHVLTIESHDTSHDFTIDYGTWHTTVMDSVALIRNIKDEDISLTDNGLTSFDIVRIVTNIETALPDQLFTSLISPAAIYQLLLTKTLKTAISEGYQLLSNVENNIDNLIGRKRRLSSKSVFPFKSRKFSTNFTWSRRGVVCKNGRYYNMPWKQHLILCLVLSSSFCKPLLPLSHCCGNSNESGRCALMHVWTPPL